ncbi:MAG: molybdopterin-guanine dinucleotide biosynthesis protein B [Chloroflexota bacterium]
MIPVVCIAGHSGSGKTTLLERLVPELKGRGYRVAAIKHTDKDVEWDHPGKDSWRLAAAGSDQIVLSTPSRVMTSTLVGKDLSLDGALRFVGGDYDIILVEGFHEAGVPRIEVHRRELGRGLLSDRHGLMAVVSDEKLNVAAPQFSWDDVGGVADLIVRKLLSSRDDVDVGLFVNGVPVRLSPFVAQFIASTMEGMVSALKGVGEVSSLDLWVRKKSG